jgi:hypothetical protein
MSAAVLPVVGPLFAMLPLWLPMTTTAIVIIIAARVVGLNLDSWEPKQLLQEWKKLSKLILWTTVVALSIIMAFNGIQLVVFTSFWLITVFFSYIHSYIFVSVALKVGTNLDNLQPKHLDENWMKVPKLIFWTTAFAIPTIMAFHFGQFLLINSVSLLEFMVSFCQWIISSNVVIVIVVFTAGVLSNNLFLPTAILVLIKAMFYLSQFLICSMWLVDYLIVVIIVARAAGMNLNGLDPKHINQSLTKVSKFILWTIAAFSIIEGFNNFQFWLCTLIWLPQYPISYSEMERKTYVINKLMNLWKTFEEN